MMHNFEIPKDSAEVSASAGEAMMTLSNSETSMSKQEAETFWNSMFENSLADEIENISDEELIKEIYDRSEDEFEFDFVVDDEIRSKISEYKENWESFSNDEKKEAIFELVELISDRLGLDETPDIRYYAGNDLSYGAYNQYNNTIELNENKLYSFEETIDTVPHELRHAYQNQCARNPRTITDVLYKINFENYISPEINWDGTYKNYLEYYDQLVEVEARAFAKLFSDGGNI